MSYNVKQAVIMVGGFGTRLLPLTKTRPKPAMPVLDRPFLKYLIDSMVNAGINEIILACGYKSDILSKEIGDGSDMGATIRYVDEDVPLGTAGAIKNVEPMLDSVFVCANGDTLNFVDVSSQIETHNRLNAEITVSMAEVEDPSSSGVMLLDANGYVLQFQEKPKKDEAISNLVNTGLYVFNKSVLKYIPNGVFSDLSKDVFPALLKDNVKICGHLAKGTWIDIGKPKDLIKMNQTMAKLLYAEVDWGNQLNNSSIIGDFYIGPGSTLSDSKAICSIISQRCIVSGSTLENSLIMKGCYIKDSIIVNSILGENCVIPAGSTIIDAVLEDNTEYHVSSSSE